MNLMDTSYRISSRAHDSKEMRTYTGTVRYYEKGKYLFCEKSPSHRLTAVDAQVDAYRLAYDALRQSQA